MTEHGPLLARGRDADIYDLGDRLVLRRARDGRSLAAEAAVMAHARAAGVPVPAVHEVTEDGAIVMERVDGPSLLRHLLRRPRRLAAAARTLAGLHATVHETLAPPAAPASGLAGDRLLHLDLHPLNVLMGSDGPVLIDWSNARSGPAAADLAMTWVLLATGTIDGPRVTRAVGRAFRHQLVEAYLAQIDRASAMRVLSDVARWRLADPNIGPIEAEQVRSMLRATSAGRRA